MSFPPMRSGFEEAAMVPDAAVDATCEPLT
jgi:hypothetical protein